LILAKVATLQEIETWYSVKDVLDANTALDVKQDYERREHERQKKAK